MNKVTSLPKEWDDMLHFEKVCWFNEHFSEDEFDEMGNAVYRTEEMTEEILKAYNDVIVYARELEKKGILID